ncbi:helix-turn-helix transcriptional regulator [Labedella populi]|uniref:helix-turn-helix transcriptional regulator n=1 Tax=Labedella populi TaxID=2498850 RepID=UPI00140909A2|nr:LuxR family transcriptional regulator [Labedella populi]
MHRRHPTTLVARSAHLEAIAGHAARALSNAAFVLVTAPAGFGKTALVDEAVSRLDDREVIRLSADSYESDLAFTTAEAVCRRLGASWPPTDTLGAPDPIDVGRMVLDVLDARTEPVCIVVDDAQWVDPASARALRFVLRRLDSQPVLVIVAGRAAADPLTTAFPRLSETDPASTLELELPPLGPDDTQALALTVLGRPVSRRSAERLTSSCGGSPLVISSAIAASASHEVDLLHPGVEDLVIPENASLAARVSAVLESAEPAARETAALVAVLRDATPVVRLRAIADRLSSPLDIDGAVALGLVRTSDRDGVPVVAAEHALLADTVVSTLPHERRLALHSAAAGEFGGHRGLRHRVEAADVDDIDLADDLIAAAWEAADIGHLDHAMELALTAVRIAGSETETESRLLTAVGLIALCTRRHERVFALIPAIERLEHSLERDLILIELYTLTGQFDEALRCGERIVTDPTTTPEARLIRAAAAEDLARVLLAKQDFAPVVEQTRIASAFIAVAPTDPADVDDASLRWLVTPGEREVRTLGWRIAGAARMGDIPTIRATIADLDAVLARLPESAATIDALVARGRVFLGMGDIDRALADLSRVDALLRRFSTSWSGGIGRSIYAHLLFMTGDWDASLSAADTAVALALDETNLSGWPIALAVSALVRAARGDTDGSDARLEAAVDVSSRLSFSAYDTELVGVARAESARARGERAAQLAATAELAAAPPTGSASTWATYRIDALAALGRPDEARPLLDLCRDARSGWRPSAGSLAWLEGRIAEADGDVTAAVARYAAAVSDPVSSRFPFPTALARLDLGRVLARSARTDEAIAELEGAAAVLARLGATPYLARASAALAALERSGTVRLARAGHADPLAALTTRERQVAHALSTGLTNREIAESLYVSVTTVNFHVRNVLAKLGLTSRRGLRTLLAARQSVDTRRHRSHT